MRSQKNGKKVLELGPNFQKFISGEPAFTEDMEDLFEEYGNVLEFNDEYVKLRVDILNFPELKYYPNSAAYTNLEELFFDAATEDQLDKPRVNTSRMDPYPKDEDFVENFYELCLENNIPIKK